MITDDQAPLHQVWGQFDENKADLASFLSDDGCELIAGGGFSTIEKSSSTRRGTQRNLSCVQEEADTRINLHGLEAQI